MSFNNHARKARDPELPLPRRASHLRSCIVHLSWLTGERYTLALARFETVLGVNMLRLNESQILSVLGAIERERNLALERLRAYERKRIREKMLGKRHPSKVEGEQLRAQLLATAREISAPPGSPTSMTTIPTSWAERLAHVFSRSHPKS